MKNIIIIFISILFFTGCQNIQPRQAEVVQTSIKKQKTIHKKKSEEPVIKEMLSDIETQTETPIVIVKDKIAIVYASKTIGKYAIEATNSAVTYLIQNKNSFELNIFDIKNENKNSIEYILDRLRTQNIKKVLFMVTSNSVDFIFEYKEIELFNIYLPLVDKTKSKYRKNNIVFGAINYKEQFKSLIRYANSNIVEIYDDSILGEKLHEELMDINNSKNIQSLKLSGKNPNFARFLKKNKIIRNSTIILNTPIIKSSIILSQIRANSIDVVEIFSTQLNYTPLLFVLTQKKDRDRLLISNSIGTLPRKLESINKLLGNNILYNWVNFSTILGLEYLKENKKLLFDKINIIDNQVEYNINLIDASQYNFKIIKVKDIR